MGQGEQERESTQAIRWQMTTEGRQGLCFTEKCTTTAGKVGHWAAAAVLQTPPPGTAFLLPAWPFHPLRLGEEPPLGRVQAHAH